MARAKKTKTVQELSNSEVIALARKICDDGEINRFELAEKIGCAHTTLCAMLRDGYKNKSLDVADDLRDFLLKRQQALNSVS